MIMIQRSLLVNGLVLLRSIISGIMESLSLFVFWTLIRWLCLEVNVIQHLLIRILLIKRKLLSIDQN